MSPHSAERPEGQAMDVPSTLRAAAQSLSASNVPWHEALAGWLLDAADSIEPQIAVWMGAGRDADQLVETYYRWPLQVARAVIEEVTREPQHGCFEVEAP